MLRSTIAAHSWNKFFFFITSDIFIHYLFQTRRALGCIQLVNFKLRDKKTWLEWKESKLRPTRKEIFLEISNIMDYTYRNQLELSHETGWRFLLRSCFQGFLFASVNWIRASRWQLLEMRGELESVLWTYCHFLHIVPWQVIDAGTIKDDLIFGQNIASAKSAAAAHT